MVRRFWRWSAVVLGAMAIVAVACTGADSPSSAAADDPVSVETDADGRTLDSDVLLPPDGEDESPPEQYPPTPPPGVEGLVAEGETAANEESAPLPEWARDAVELSAEQRPVAADERLLVLLGCTNCDGATAPVGSWNAEEGLERTLFPGAQRGSDAVSADGSGIAVLVCPDGCGPGGVPRPQSLFWSEDGGWSWREFALPLGFWSSEGFDMEGRLVLRRIEFETDGFGSTLVERVAYPERTPLPLDEEFDRNAHSTAQDADGERWSARDPVGPNAYPSYGLFRGAELVHDFEPYVVTALGFAGEGAVAIGLQCRAFGAEGEVFSRCSAELLGAAPLLIRGDGETASYRVAAGLVQLPETRDDEFPTLAGLRWVGDEALWGQLVSFSPRLIRRPVFIDLEADVAEVFVEDVPTPSDVVPLAFGNAPARVPVESVDGVCVPLTFLPRDAGDGEVGSCIVRGELTGESAMDAGGAEWVFVEADDGAGWARVEDLGR
jgi:hypothetical protein